MKLFKLHFSLIFFIVFVSELHSQNAPITQSGVFLPSGPNASIPIKVLNFNSIGAISLTMEYDALIAQANTVTANPALAVGSFTYSILTPGSIVISWYSNTAVNLDDASDLFVISFSRVSVGTTSLVWFDDGTSCEYAKFDNGSYTVLNDSPSSTYYPSGQLTFQEDAPHTIVSDVIACANSIVHIPVTVSNFHDIGAISLTLDYNPSVLLFQGFTAESSLPSNFTVQSTIAGQVVASGYETSGGSGTSLADNTVLFTMDFMYYGGNCDLNWYDDGPSCEYGSLAPSYTPLYDIPTENYYFHGSISEHSRPTVAVSGTTTIINGQYTDISFSLTGTPPWTLTYSDGSNQITIPNIMSSPKILSVHPQTTTTYTVSVLNDQICDALPSNISGSAVITVNEAPIDISIHKSSNCGEFIVKLKPTIDVNSNLNKIIFTIKWAAIAGSNVLLNNIITSWPGLQQVGNRELLGGYYYVTYRSTTNYAINWLANSENIIMSFYNSGTGDGTVDFSIIPSDYNSVPPGLNTAYYIEQSGANATGSITNDALGASLNCGLYVKDFLQGPYNTSTHLMNTNLNTLNYIPLVQPYNTAPWLYNGSEHIATYPAGTVDWVLVELRSASAANTSVCKRAGLLKNDGTLTDTNGTSPLVFHSIIPGEAYYVVIYHRNHLPVMTKNAITLPNTAATKHDFTINPLANTYKTVGEAVLPLETGIYGQIAGDINHDNRLKYSGGGSDRGAIISKINSILSPIPATLNSVISGYYNEDLNMNGMVKYSGPLNDQNIIYLNIDALTNPTTLNSVYSGQVPVNYAAKAAGLTINQISNLSNLIVSQNYFSRIVK